MIYSSKMNGREGKKLGCFRVRITLQFKDINFLKSFLQAYNSYFLLIFFLL